MFGFLRYDCAANRWGTATTVVNIELSRNLRCLWLEIPVNHTCWLIVSYLHLSQVGFGSRLIWLVLFCLCRFNDAAAAGWLADCNLFLSLVCHNNPDMQITPPQKPEKLKVVAGWETQSAILKSWWWRCVLLSCCCYTDLLLHFNSRPITGDGWIAVQVGSLVKPRIWRGMNVRICGM